MTAEIENLIRAAREEGLNEYVIGGRGWASLLILRKHLKQHDQISSKWLDYRAHIANFESEPNMWNESTYDQCVHWSFDVHTLVLKVRMEDGDAYDGRPTRAFAEWKFRLTVHDEAIFEELINKCITNQLMEKAYRIYNAEQEARHHKAALKIFNKMLNKE